MSATTIGPEQVGSAETEKQIPRPQTGLGMTSLEVGARVPTEGTGPDRNHRDAYNADAKNAPGMTNLGRRPGFFRTMWRLLRQLFHETTGALFAAMSLACVNSSVRAWRAGESRWIVAMPAVFAAMMGYFAVTQFLRARKIV